MRARLQPEDEGSRLADQRRTSPPARWVESTIAGDMRRHGTRTFRLAVGIFSDLGPLTGALAELLALGCTVDCLCLFGLPAALGSGRWSDAPGEVLAAFRGLFDKVVPAEGSLGSLDCMASAGPLMADLSSPALEAMGGGGDFPLWLTEAQFKRLERHILSGGLVLVVSSANPEYHDATCRTLLRHSQHGLQTHDFTLGAAMPAATSGRERP